MNNIIIKAIDKFKVNKIENINTISSDFLSINTSKYYLNNGEIITRDLVIKPLKDAAMVIPKTIDNKYLMVIQPRIATKNGVAIEFPAGYIEENENAIDGIKRELVEETGYESNHIEILREYYPDIGACSSMVTLAIADNCKKVADQHLDSDEFIEYIEVTFEEIEELLQNKYIVDGNTILAIEILRNMKN
jgi:ADP-ribose pyrophosphatase